MISGAVGAFREPKTLRVPSEVLTVALNSLAYLRRDARVRTGMSDLSREEAEHVLDDDQSRAQRERDLDDRGHEQISRIARSGVGVSTVATFALCGFANLSSIGMQIGGIGALAPTRRNDLARLGLRAMLAGTMANLMSASIAGMLL